MGLFNKTTAAAGSAFVGGQSTFYPNSLQQEGWRALAFFSLAGCWQRY